MSNDLSAGLDAQKQALRAEARLRREQAAAVAEASPAGLRDQFLAAVTLPPSAVVSAYWPKGVEMDARLLMCALHDLGHRIVLPVVVAKAAPLLFRCWQPGDRLERGGFGVSVPGADQPTAEPNFLIVPLLAFDRAGYRLGYGGGFYDRSLAALRRRATVTAAGIAFAAQEVEAVPRDAKDQALDWIVTEEEAIEIG